MPGVTMAMPGPTMARTAFASLAAQTDAAHSGVSGLCCAALDQLRGRHGVAGFSEIA